MAGAVSDMEQEKDGLKGEMERAEKELETHKAEARKQWDKIQVKKPAAAHAQAGGVGAERVTVWWAMAGPGGRAGGGAHEEGGARGPGELLLPTMCDLPAEGGGQRSHVSRWLVLQVSGMRESEIRERQEWESQLRKAEDLHRREMEDLRRTLTEDADRRVAKGE